MCSTTNRCGTHRLTGSQRRPGKHRQSRGHEKFKPRRDTPGSGVNASAETCRRNPANLGVIGLFVQEATPSHTFSCWISDIYLGGCPKSHRYAESRHGNYQQSNGPTDALCFESERRTDQMERRKRSKYDRPTALNRVASFLFQGFEWSFAGLLFILVILGRRILNKPVADFPALVRMSRRSSRFQYFCRRVWRTVVYSRGQQRHICRQYYHPFLTFPC